MIDLHTHSTASDGTFSPGALVAKAHREGLAALALTDHDTVDGVPEARRVADELGLEFVPGVEISAEADRGSLHIVGLFIEVGGRLAQRLRALVGMRDERNERLVARLAQLGRPIELEEALAYSGGAVLGRPHFAQAMMARGYVNSVEDAFLRYLGKSGSAHLPKQRLPRRDAIELIRSAGGVPVLAHPNQTQLEGPQLEILVRELKDLGLVGLETHYTGYTKKQTRRFRRLARAYNLLESGGSDFHGTIKPGISLGIGAGTLHVPDEFLPPLQQAAEALRQGRM